MIFFLILFLLSLIFVTTNCEKPAERLIRVVYLMLILTTNIEAFLISYTFRVQNYFLLLNMFYLTFLRKVERFPILFLAFSLNILLQSSQGQPVFTIILSVLTNFFECLFIYFGEELEFNIIVSFFLIKRSKKKKETSEMEQITCQSPMTLQDYIIITLF